jgi:hypothetical protein
MSRRFVAALAVTLVSAAPMFVSQASAQTPAATSFADAVAASTLSQFAAEQSAMQLPREMPKAGTWSTPVLTALQVGTLATQLLDAHSTIKALNAGAVEGNPMMAGLAGNRAAFIGVKAAVGAGLIYATHRMGQRNKMAAIAVAAAANTAFLTIASRNYRLAHAIQ